MRVPTTNVDFFDWLDTLTDDEHSQVLQELRLAARELGIRVNRNPLVAKELFELLPSRHALISLN